MGNNTFEDMAMRITPSPPPSQGSASTAVESKYLNKVKAIHYARLGLSVIFVALGTAAVASEGHALQVYNHTHLDSQWWLPLWPQYFDVRQTVTVLAGSAIIVFTSLIYIIAALIPSVSSKSNHQISPRYTISRLIPRLSPAPALPSSPYSSPPSPSLISSPSS